MGELLNYDIGQIMKMLPHRYPFLLVDKVVDIDPGESGIGIKNVTINEPYFQGHFPDLPVMPGVLMIEAMAQTAAVVVMSGMADQSIKREVFFMAIDSAKFRRPVGPGDRVELHLSKDRARGQVWKFKAEALVDGKRVAEAKCTAMIRDIE